MDFVLASVPFEMGCVTLLAGGNGEVKGLSFELDGAQPVSPERRGPWEAEEAWETDPLCSGGLVGELMRYFKGEKFRWSFTPDLSPDTAFTRAVYERTMRIPYGETSSYGQIATDVGSPGGSRAVGQAMGRNRFPLVIPCHRVVAGNGSIGGFSSGLNLKRFLLALEGVSL